jgi:Trypsin-co-occurring domain 1
MSADCGEAQLDSQVVSYRLDDSTVVRFETDTLHGSSPAGSREVAGQLREAIGPAVEAARVVLDKVREAGPGTVEVKFGLKASGATTWLVAKGSVEANFEVTLTWERADSDDHADSI